MKVYDGANWLAAYATLAGALIAASNLSDLVNAADARVNLGINANYYNKTTVDTLIDDVETLALAGL